MTVFRTAHGRAAPMGTEEMDMSSRRVSFTRLEEVVEIRDILKWGSGRLCRYNQVSCGFVIHGFDACG
jgi:hypothetical protein